MSGRKPANVEFINKLRDLVDVTSTSTFAHLCGKTPSNISAYLKGSKIPGDRVLKGCFENIAVSRFAWPIEPEREILSIDDDSPMPTSGGVYVLYDSGGNVLYIGKATNLRSEVKVALRKPVPVGLRVGTELRKTRPALQDLTSYVSLYLIDDARLRHNVEALLLRVFANQTHNANIGRFKRISQ